MITVGIVYEILVRDCALHLQLLSCKTESKAAEDLAGWKLYIAMLSQSPTTLPDITSSICLSTVALASTLKFCHVCEPYQH